MRCARCDRILMAESLARSPDGELVFGWCAACQKEQGCTPVEIPSVPLTARQERSFRKAIRKLGRDYRKLQNRPRSLAASRRLAALGVSGLMAAWALILAFVGGWKLGGVGRPQGAFLLFGSGLMALVSLIVWLGVIGRTDRVRIGLKMLQVAAAVAAFGTIAWGIAHHDAAQNPLIITLAAVGFTVSWSARRYERARFVAKDRAKSSVL